ncbi:alpha/beta hydrolase [Nocardia inohanensis]|uniref:alpha/beta hydrolase n=1 Tax=Nocardia inohanensis TaxID=209246 RepID=UPI000834F28D|nr:alpha/beta hydrolase [Nocardia inohanensis]
MPYFEGGRGRLHYRRWPVAEGAAVLVLLPGTGQHSGHYHRFASGLAGAGIELWALDTSGHGLSEGDPERPGDLSELCADADAFVEEVTRLRAEAAPWFLMGHSLGAATVLAGLGDGLGAGCAGVVLCGTPQRILRGEAPRSARGSSGAVPERRGAAIAVGRVPGGVESTSAGRTFTSRVPEALPVLVVHGVDDRRTPIDPVREWARSVDAEFREYADAGHDLLHDPVQGEVTGDIADWIGRVNSNR